MEDEELDRHRNRRVWGCADVGVQWQIDNEGKVGKHSGTLFSDSKGGLVIDDHEYGEGRRGMWGIGIGKGMSPYSSVERSGMPMSMKHGRKVEFVDNSQTCPPIGMIQFWAGEGNTGLFEGTTDSSEVFQTDENSCHQDPYLNNTTDFFSVITLETVITSLLRVRSLTTIAACVNSRH